MGTSRQAPHAPDEVGQAGLPRLNLVLVHLVAVTDENARPVVDESREGFFGPAEMNQVERCGVTDHHPEPLECVREKPGRFIYVVDGRMTWLAQRWPDSAVQSPPRLDPRLSGGPPS